MRIDDARVQLKRGRQDVARRGILVAPLAPRRLGGLHQAADPEERVVDVPQRLCGFS